VFFNRLGELRDRSFENHGLYIDGQHALAFAQFDNLIGHA
jgi:hypothetical protein